MYICHPVLVFSTRRHNVVVMTKVSKNIKRLLLILGFMAPVTLACAQNAGYIADHRFVANLLSQYYGIPAPVILSVAAIESSGGEGPAAKVLNNHFGIVGKNNIVNRNGHKSRYKQYGNEYASYVDFCKLVTRKRFYPKLKDNDNCRLWVKALSHAGYSEVPEEWEQKVLSVLDRIEANYQLAYR